MSIFLGNLREFEETFKEEQKLLEVGVTASCMERRRQEAKKARGKKRQKRQKRQEGKEPRGKRGTDVYFKNLLFSTGCIVCDGSPTERRYCPILHCVLNSRHTLLSTSGGAN